MIGLDAVVDDSDAARGLSRQTRLGRGKTDAGAHIRRQLVAAVSCAHPREYARDRESRDAVRVWPDSLGATGAGSLVLLHGVLHSQTSRGSAGRPELGGDEPQNRVYRGAQLTRRQQSSPPVRRLALQSGYQT
jgi:hypothetical protein